MNLYLRICFFFFLNQKIKDETNEFVPTYTFGDKRHCELRVNLSPFRLFARGKPGSHSKTSSLINVYPPFYHSFFFLQKKRKPRTFLDKCHYFDGYKLKKI